MLLFSGGEPLMREDLFELGAYARELGIRPVISTNGTLITKSVAGKIKEIGFAYVGISLDGVGETNDTFRGVKGAFDAAMRGLRELSKYRPESWTALDPDQGQCPRFAGNL